MSDNIPDPNLKLYFPMTALNDDGKTTANLVPSSPVKSALLVQSSITPDPLLGNCLSFNGPIMYDAKARIGATNFDYSQGLTIEAWVFRPDNNQPFHVMYSDNANNGAKLMRFLYDEDARTLNLEINNTDSSNVNQLFSIQLYRLITGAWTHLAATIDKQGNACMYQNSVPIPSALLQNGQKLPVGMAHLGVPDTVSRSRTYVGSGCTGSKMAQFRLYNRALTEAEIAYDMRQTGQGVGYTVKFYKLGTTAVTKNVDNILFSLGCQFGNRAPFQRMAALQFTTKDNGLNLSGTIKYTDAPTIMPAITEAANNFQAKQVPGTSEYPDPYAYDVSNQLADGNWYPGGQFIMSLHPLEYATPAQLPDIYITGMDITFTKNPAQSAMAEQDIDMVLTGTATMSDGSTLLVDGYRDAPPA